MDPNVQVAIATVVGTTITTLGVIAVAYINSRRGGDEDDDNSTDDIAYLKKLIDENSRKETTIARLRSRIEVLETENNRLQAEIDQLKGEL